MKGKMTMVGGAGQSSHKQNNTKMSPEITNHYSPFKKYFCCRAGGLPKVGE